MAAASSCPTRSSRQLWRAAQEKTRPAAGVRPPVGAVITEIENEATVAKDVVRVKATVKIDLLVEGWHEIPLRLADAAITAATLGGEPARIVGGPGEDYRLLVEKKGKQPEQIVLSLEYAKAISKMPGQNSVSFQAPQAPVSRWRVRIPQAGVKVNLHPLIAATEVPAAAAASGDKTAKPGEAKPARPTRPSCWPSSARRRWSASTGPPRPRAPPAWPPWSASRPNSRCGSTRGPPAAASTWPTPISRAELGQLAVEVPADYKVVNVFDANVRQWSVEPVAAGAKTQKITAQLFEPAKKLQQVVVELEKFAGEKLQPSQTVPVVKALDVGRQQASWSSRWRPGSAPRPPRATGLLQVDAGELPDALRRQPWTFSYRYAAVPYELVLGVEELQPRVTADSLVEARLEPERLTLDVTAVYNIERAGIFKLELAVPPGFALRHVRGCDLPGDAATRAVAAQVDSYHLEGEEQGPPGGQPFPQGHGPRRPGRRVAEGLAGAEPADADGQDGRHSPDGPAGRPRHRRAGRGRLVIFAPESLRVNPAKAEGLRSISFKEAAEGIVRRAAAAAGPGPPRAGLRLHPGADHPAPGRPAAEAPSDPPAVARRPDRTGRGEVPGDLPLQHPL